MSEKIFESPVREGDIIADKYRVERVLGVGGMGVVVAAVHLELEERVALKFLLPEGTANPSIAARFAQEARAAVKIKSEHVARVVDVGRLANGDPFMVMEYLDGEDLERVLAARGPLPFDVAVGYLLEACEAIAEAHALGIVHRDLKPANLFLAQRPSGPPIVKVLDFGISKSLGPTTRAQLTQTASLLGSPLYMSPEQMSGSKLLDARTDLWALGVVLFELLSGALPFEGESMPMLVASVLSSPPRALSVFRTDVPPALEVVIARCLAKLPGDRFADVGELARALAPFAPRASSVSLPRIEHLLGAAPARARALGVEEVPISTRSGSSTAGAVSQETVASSRVGSRGAGRRTLWIAVAAVVAALGLLWGSLSARPRTTAVVASAASASSPPAAEALNAPSFLAAPPSTGAPPVAGPTPSAVIPAVATASAMPVTTAAKAPSGSGGSGSVKAKPHDRAATPPPTARPAPVVDCDPPYLIDPVTGHRNYKPECMP